MLEANIQQISVNSKFSGNKKPQSAIIAERGLMSNAKLSTNIYEITSKVNIC
jgi:hypothetical protein